VLSIERLTAEDRLILWPDEVWPQDVGALVLLDGSSLLDSEGRLRIEAAKQAIEDRLHVLPRFRQVLYVPRRGRGGPLWIDAPAFDLSEHVRVEQLQPRLTRRHCCGRSRGCGGALWTSHARCGRCGSSPV
jgi:diacylglycerol O-acyltransferase / wax synthase